VTPGEEPSGPFGASEPFEAFVAQRAPELYRTALLLAGAPEPAADLLQRSLIAVERDWPQLTGGEQATTATRRALVAEHTSWRRRIWLGDLLASVPTLASVSRLPGFASPGTDPGPRDATTTALGQLPAGLRVVLVLRYGEALTEAATAELLGWPVDQVVADEQRGLRRLGDQLGDDDPAGRLRRDLGARAAQVTAAPAALLAQVRDGRQAQRNHLAGLAALLAFAVLVVLVVALTV
jgi:DNA-directed RNA polymerase specialized sigma24 family protein